MDGDKMEGPKICDKCGVLFWKGERYNTVVLVLLIIFLFPVGIIYWLVKRHPRCPRCGSKQWHLATKEEQKRAEKEGRVFP